MHGVTIVAGGLEGTHCHILPEAGMHCREDLHTLPTEVVSWHRLCGREWERGTNVESLDPMLIAKTSSRRAPSARSKTAQNWEADGRRAPALGWVPPEADPGTRTY